MTYSPWQRTKLIDYLQWENLYTSLGLLLLPFDEEMITMPMISKAKVKIRKVRSVN